MFVIADELSGLVLNQREGSFTCQPCRDNQNQHSSLKEELQRKLTAGLEEVLADLLSDASTQHLLICKTVRFTHLSTVWAFISFLPLSVYVSLSLSYLLFCVSVSENKRHALQGTATSLWPPSHREGI